MTNNCTVKKSKSNYQLWNFSIQHFISALQKGHHIEEFNRILAGLIAHAIFGFSREYGKQINVS